MKSKFELPEGHEIRGEVIRIYPTREQEQKLAALQQSLKTCWNWLVKQTQEVIDARGAYAVRAGLVGPHPVRPEYDGMTTTEAAAAKVAHSEACREWYRRVYELTNKLDCCSWRPKFKEMIEMYSTESRPLRHDYQFMREVILGGYEWPENHPRPSAHLLQAVVHNYFTSGRAADGKGRAKGQQRKKFRRRDDDMPLVVRSGECLRVGDFTPKYEKPGQHRSYNCQIAFEGMKFLGKLPGRTPAGRILQGVAITHLADGWYASIKQIVPKRALPEAVPGSLIGMNMGLDKMVALSDGRVVENPRGHALAREISRLQSIEKPTGRLHQKMARIARHKLYNELVKPLATAETIKIEKLDANVGFLPHDWDGKSSNQKSCMRLAGRILKERYGDRVREVECFNVSVTCSQCGKISVDAWAYRADPVCKCPHCGLVLDRDINAARNVASKPLELQDAAE